MYWAPVEGSVHLVKDTAVGGSPAAQGRRGECRGCSGLRAGPPRCPPRLSSVPPISLWSRSGSQPMCYTPTEKNSFPLLDSCKIWQNISSQKKALTELLLASLAAGGSHSSLKPLASANRLDRTWCVETKASEWPSAGSRTRTGRGVRDLHVKGSISQPSGVAEGREQTSKVRKRHRELSGKVSDLHKGAEAQEVLSESASWSHF